MSGSALGPGSARSKVDGTVSAGPSGQKQNRKNHLLSGLGGAHGRASDVTSVRLNVKEVETASVFSVQQVPVSSAQTSVLFWRNRRCLITPQNVSDSSEGGPNGSPTTVCSLEEATGLCPTAAHGCRETLCAPRAPAHVHAKPSIFCFSAVKVCPQMLFNIRRSKIPPENAGGKVPAVAAGQTWGGA